MQQDVIDELANSLPLQRSRRRAIARELRTHLEETRRELELSGWQPEEAARESLRRFGDPAQIVEEFSRMHQPRRRRQLGLALGLAGALLLGAYSAGATLASSPARHHRAAVHVQPHRLLHGSPLPASTSR